MARRSIERSVENVFDGVFSRVFRSGIKPMQIGRRLIQQIDADRDVDANGRRVVPNTYVVQLSTHDREALQDLEPALVQELKEAAREYIKQEGYHADGKVRVVLHTNPDLRKGRFDINSRNDSHSAPPSPPVAQPAPSEHAAVDTDDLQPAPSIAPTPTPTSMFDRAPAVLTLPTGQRIELHEGHYTVGRGLDSDIVISDTNVSRLHAEFVCADDEVIVRDKGSTNGTKVNGVSITGDQLLQNGDIVNFGTAQVRFEST